MVTLFLPQLTYQSLSMGKLVTYCKYQCVQRLKKCSLPLIYFILAFNSDSSAVGEPPPVLRVEETFSQIIGLCLVDHFFETFSLLLKVPICDNSLTISFQIFSFHHKRLMNLKHQIVLTCSLELGQLAV